MTPCRRRSAAGADPATADPAAGRADPAGGVIRSETVFGTSETFRNILTDELYDNVYQFRADLAQVTTLRRYVATYRRPDRRQRHALTHARATAAGGASDRKKIMIIGKPPLSVEEKPNF